MTTRLQRLMLIAKARNAKGKIKSDAQRIFNLQMLSIRFSDKIDIDINFSLWISYLIIKHRVCK